MRETVLLVREAKRFDPHVIRLLIGRAKESRTDNIVNDWLFSADTSSIIERLLKVECFVVARNNGDVLAVATKEHVACRTPGCIHKEQPAIEALYINQGHHQVGRTLLEAVELEAQKKDVQQIHAHIAIQPETTHKFFVQNGWLSEDNDMYLKDFTHRSSRRR